MEIVDLNRLTQAGSFNWVRCGAVAYAASMAASGRARWHSR